MPASWKDNHKGLSDFVPDFCNMYVSRWATSSPERAGITKEMEDKQPALSRFLIGAAFHTDT